MTARTAKFFYREPTTYVFFRVIPHTSNLNSSSRKFQHSLYELLSYRYDRFPWEREGIAGLTSRDNLYLRIKSPPRFWWVISLRGTKGTTPSGDEVCIPQIEFNVGVPEDFRESFKTKFYNHEQWKRATLELRREQFDFPDPDQSDFFVLKYARSDMFSLEYDYTQQNTPLREILSVSRELAIGESVNLFIQTETLSRKKWKSLADYAWSVWERGGVPSRPGFDPKMLASEITSLAYRGIHEVKGVIDELLVGVNNVFFHQKEQVERKKLEYSNPERQSLLVNGDLSKRTRSKRNLPVFKTRIVYTVSSRDKIRRSMLSRSISGAFSDLIGDNYLQSYKSSSSKRDLDLLSQWEIRHRANLMSVDELGKLQQLPTVDLQREFSEALAVNKRTEITVSTELLNPKGILAGTVTDRGNKNNIHIQLTNPDLTFTSRAIIGSPRMGKDQAAINLVVEAKRKHNIGAVVLDVINEQNGHRGMADAIRDHLPAEDVIDLNLLDTDNPIYLGLEPIVKMIPNQRIAADRVAEELCAFLLQDGDEDKLQTADHLREASKLTNADILAIRHLFTSETYREKLMEEKGDQFDLTIWEQYNSLSEGRQQAIYTPVMRRIGQIMNSEFLKPIFCQRPNPKLDIFRFLDEGKVIIFRMKSGVMSQRVIDILSYWIVLVTFLVKLGQQGNTRSRGTFLVLNEPHQYLTSGLVHLIERIFAEGPKYRFAPILIFHHFKQFKAYPGFVDMMKSASLNWHIFRNTNEDVYRELFGYLSKTFSSPQEAFQATKMYQYIGVWLSSTGEYYDPFVADALPLVGTRYQTEANQDLTRLHSKIYGRPINFVLEEIKRRNREVLPPPDKTNKSKGKPVH